MSLKSNLFQLAAFAAMAAQSPNLFDTGVGYPMGKSAPKKKREQKKCKSCKFCTKRDSFGGFCSEHSRTVGLMDIACSSHNPRRK